MTSVPELPRSRVTKPKQTMIVCTRGNKKLTDQDNAELQKFMEYRKRRTAKKRSNN